MNSNYLDSTIREQGSEFREKIEHVSNVAETIIRDTSANPAPLGLMGFGITTILLNMHNIGLFGLSSMIVAMGLFYGGIAQIIAGIMEWKKKNTFGTVAFTSYGLFWIAFVAMVLMPQSGMIKHPGNYEVAAFLFLWGLFTLIMFIGSLKINKALTVVFLLLSILFFLLAFADALNFPTLKVIAGYEGIICGLSAVYAGAAQILNEVYGKTILPLGEIE